MGLEYDLEKAVAANRFDAHRLTHLAAQPGLQVAAEERLFRAYLLEGKDLGNQETLLQIGTKIGFPSGEVTNMLRTDAFADAVHRDQRQAQQVGVQGVPFFVFNGKYAVSGAQSPEVFSQVLQRAWTEEQAAPEPIEGAFCWPGGNCLKIKSPVFHRAFICNGPTA